MGIYDRDYYRPQPPGISLGGPRTIVATLILINVAVFLADGLFTPRDHQITELLSARVGTLTQPWMWWQLLTYGFTHSSWPDYWHILGNMLGLWFLGRDIELTYGRKEFLRLYLTLLVFGSVVWCVSCKFQGVPDGVHLVGASGAVVGIVVLYALHFPRRTLLLYFVIPIPAWLLGVLLVLSDLYGAASGGAGRVAYSVHLAGAGFALLYYRFGWNLGRLTGGRFSLAWLKRRPKLRVHRPENRDPDNVPSDKPSNDKLSKEVDRILEKIHRQGEASLSRSERRTLEAASRKYQKKQRP